MNAGMPSRPARGERVVSGMLALALLGGVLWALARNGGIPGLSL